MSNKTDLSLLLNEININISEDQSNQLIEFVGILLDANKTINLTAITGFNEAMIKHIYDALLIMTIPEFESVQNIIDVGSGGGIPSIPLAICNPNKKIISLEATQKKINFQIQACHRLNLTNIIPIWGRAEEVARQIVHREQYDLAIARAVAPVNVIAELTIPFIKLNGRAVFYKGKEAANELSNGETAIKTMGAKIIEMRSFTLPSDIGSRALILVQKSVPTPSFYPRKPGFPQKKPL